MIEISRIDRSDKIQGITLRERAESGSSIRTSLFLAMSDGSEAGLVLYEDWSERRLAYVYEIFVLPQFRRCRIGHLLLSYCEARALALDCRTIRLKARPLSSFPDTDRLMAWYTSCGYRPMPNSTNELEKRIMVVPS